MEKKSPIYYHRVDVDLLQHILSVYLVVRFFNKTAISPPAVSDTQEVTTANSCPTLARGIHVLLLLYYYYCLEVISILFKKF